VFTASYALNPTKQALSFKGIVLVSYSLIEQFIVMTEKFFVLFSIGNPKVYQLGRKFRQCILPEAGLTRSNAHKLYSSGPFLIHVSTNWCLSGCRNKE
jgi:hypothetical protein